MTSTMIPLPKAGAGFAGATPVRRPGESGPAVDEQSFADRFDRALDDARSRNDRADSADSTGEAGKSEPRRDHHRVDEAGHESSRLDKNNSDHLHNNEDPPDVAGQKSSGIGVVRSTERPDRRPWRCDKRTCCFRRGRI